jgi:hypothetical protein
MRSCTTTRFRLRSPYSAGSWCALALWFLPALLVHLHVEYAQIRELLSSRAQKRLWLALAYLPAAALFPKLYGALRLREVDLTSYCRATVWVGCFRRGSLSRC